MASTAESYRNPQPQIEQKELSLQLTRGQVARTLNELCAMGLLEKFKDEYNITRYRLANGRTT